MDGTGLIELRSSTMTAHLRLQGGAMLSLWWGAAENGVPLLRPSLPDGTAPIDTAGFPLVPFGNRLGSNRFSCGGKTYALEPNSDLDPLYIHGDGWLERWSLQDQGTSGATLAYRHRGTNGPYRYLAEQRFSLDDERLSLRLAVTNEGDDTLPFGLGWHPYFVLADDTTLQFSASSVRPEGAGSLPGPAVIPAGAFDFGKARRFPAARLNNGYSGWDGTALIRYPRHALELEVSADPVFAHAFLYAPFGEANAGFFCFEPMSHMADDHNRDGFGDLRLLEPGQRLEGSIRLAARSRRPD